MSSIFSKIASGQIPSYKIAEDENFYAFLDINPLGEGHTLVVPKEEIDYIFDLNEEVLVDMMVFAQKIAEAIKEVIPCNRIGVSVIGLEVPHAHIHLVPINTLGDINFSKIRPQISKEVFEDLSQKISQKVIL